MNTQPGKVILASCFVLVAGLSYLKISNDASALDEPRVLSDVQERAPVQNDLPESGTKETLQQLQDEANKPGQSDARKQMLEHPKVINYFEHEQDKIALDSYFNDENARYSSEQIWTLIEKIETEGRVFAFEALSLKLRWLEKNAASREEFEARSQMIISSYRQRAEDAQKAFDPNDIPGFAEYKEVEAQIVARINDMHSFPNGMSRQDYLRQELLAARVKAYGEHR